MRAPVRWYSLLPCSVSFLLCTLAPRIYERGGRAKRRSGRVRTPMQQFPYFHRHCEPVRRLVWQSASFKIQPYIEPGVPQRCWIITRVTVPLLPAAARRPRGKGFAYPTLCKSGRPMAAPTVAVTIPSGHRAVTTPTALAHALPTAAGGKTGHRFGGVPLLSYSDRYKFRFLMAFWAASSGVILPLRQSVTGSMTIWRMMRLGRAGVVRLSTQPFSS